jgi:16S rRNA processing protein RimM
LSLSSDEPGGQELLVVGKILRPHGVRGAVIVAVESDWPQRFADGARLLLQKASGDLEETTVVSCSEYKGNMLLYFPGVEDRETAERLKGCYLMVRAADAAPLADGEYWAHELEGMRVLSEDGGELGEVCEVVCRAAQDMLVVRDAKGSEFQVPFVGEFVKKVDTAGGAVTVKVIDGMVP